MVQQITTQYQEFNSSEVQNRRYVNVIQAGVYTGYAVAVNPGIINVLDITSGDDASSTLVTPGGSVVTESTSVAAAFKVAPADPSFSRIDALVGEYTYSTNPNEALVYRVVRGRNQLDLSQQPELPTINEATQVVLAHVKVSAGADRITNNDVVPAPKATWATQEEWANLRPEVNYSDNRLLFVYPGTYLNGEGTGILTFPGGNSNVITDSTFVEGTERYYLFALTDSLTVQAVAWSETQSGLAETDANSFAIAQVRARSVNGRIELMEVRDLRMPFSRTRARSNEDLKYQDLLANSVFQYLRVENFENTDSLVLGSTVGGTATIDEPTQSLKVTGTAGVDVEVVTGDLVVGSSIGTVEQFMISADSLVENLTFDYSTVSPSTGFTGNRYRMGEVVDTGSRIAARLYIKFYIPAAEFAVNDSTSIFSYGVLINLDNDTTNVFSIKELGLRELRNSVSNLIANGDFYYWSKNTSIGNDPDLLTSNTQDFTVTEDSPTVADGWQFTNINTDFGTGAVERGFVEGNPSLTALTLNFQPISTDGGDGGDNRPTVLEYRLPRAASMVGQRLTFGMDIAGATAEAVTIGIGQFRRTSSGLVLVQRDEVSVKRSTSSPVVTTGATVDVTADVISFFVTFASATGDNVTLSRARAVVGEYTSLPYTYTAGAPGLLQSYNERGRFYVAGSASNGSVVGTSQQFGSPKHLELGDLVTRTAESVTANRSADVANLSYTGDRTTITVSGTATSDSSFVLQTEWEAFVKYTGSIV